MSLAYIDSICHVCKTGGGFISGPAGANVKDARVSRQFMSITAVCVNIDRLSLPHNKQRHSLDSFFRNNRGINSQNKGA